MVRRREEEQDLADTESRRVYLRKDLREAKRMRWLGVPGFGGHGRIESGEQGQGIEIRG